METSEVFLGIKSWIFDYIRCFITLVLKKTPLVVKVRTTIKAVVLCKIIKRMASEESVVILFVINMIKANCESCVLTWLAGN